MLLVVLEARELVPRFVVLQAIAVDRNDTTLPYDNISVFPGQYLPRDSQEVTWDERNGSWDLRGSLGEWVEIHGENEVKMTAPKSF